MINILTSHNHIWESERVVVEIIKQYQDRGFVELSMNNEGPCADSIGLYKLLDNIVEKFGFSKEKITIQTRNREEIHPQYNIIKHPQWWIKSCLLSFDKLNFAANKNVGKNLFGLIYNVPSWDRLCLLSHVYHNNKNSSLLFCNGTWEAHKYNSLYLNTITDFCPNEIYKIVDFLKSNPKSALDDVNNKPVTAESMLKVATLYNDFFIDVVAETYNQGLSFFITEKTLRPILTKTPFIINGPQGFLSTLKSDYGFRSFDRWWDESYDSYQNYDRIKKIYQVIDYIDSLSHSDLVSMYKDMQEVLEHNYQTLQNLK
jgi:hypothetical protein